MASKSCCFTGHRVIEASKFIYVKHRLLTVIEELIGNGITDFYAGGALGFDTVAAFSVLEAKGRHSEIKLHLILPCKNQADGWSYINRENYNDILSKADSVTYVSEHYTKFCMQLRNRALVDSSSICVCLLEKTKGGTAYTVDYAIKKGLKIINIME